MHKITLKMLTLIKCNDDEEDFTTKFSSYNTNMERKVKQLF